MIGNLPSNCEIMYEDQRQPHGYYDIPSMFTHIYPFSIYENNPLTISIVLRNVDKQDEALCAWVSSEPLDYTIFPKVRFLSPLVVLRTVNNFTIYDSNTKGQLLNLPSGNTYYLNVQNRQNYPNQYGLMFDLLQSNCQQQPSPFY